MKAIQPNTSSKSRISAKGKSTGYKAPAIHKAFQLLKLVAESNKSMGIIDLARQLDYSKSTTHGLVHALLREGALVQGPNSRKLSLGQTVAQLFFLNWRTEKIKEKVQPVLYEIRDYLNEMVILGVRIQKRVLILATAETYDSMKISVSVGSSIPLMAGAAGKAFLAMEDEETALSMIQEYGLPAYTPNTISEPGPYLAELKKVKSQGYALDNEEYLPGIKAVAMALGNLRGLPAALWVVGISANMDPSKTEKITGVIRDKSDRLIRLMNSR